MEQSYYDSQSASSNIVLYSRFIWLNRSITLIRAETERYDIVRLSKVTTKSLASRTKLQVHFYPGQDFFFLVWKLFDNLSLVVNVRRLCVVVESLISTAKVCDCVISAWCWEAELNEVRAWGVDKTRNTEHSGTCRNIPKHPGTWKNKNNFHENINK